MVVPTERVDCVSCKGTGELSSGSCPACDGRGKVTVAKPVTKCPRCNGTGNTPHKDEIIFHTPFCPVCRGVGWALVLSE